MRGSVMKRSGRGERRSAGRSAGAGAPRGSQAAPPGLVLRLYIAPAAPNSVQAQANLRSFLARVAAEDYSLEVIDCLSQPRRALQDGVLVTPTLVKVAPAPMRTVVGSLRDADRLAAALGVAQPEARSGSDA